MPFKVKEHFRKTKKGLTRVKETSRKDRAKKLGLTVGALTTVGLAALALKNKSLLKTATKISSKADDVAASKAKDITNLVTPKKLTTGKTYNTLPDPWLEGSTTASKSNKALTTAKKETKLLTGSKYKAEDIADPWDSSVKPKPKLKNKTKKTNQLLLSEGKYKSENISDPWDDEIISGTNKVLTVDKRVITSRSSKQKPLLLKPGRPEYEAPTVPSRISNRRDKDLAGEIRSQRTLIAREPKDIVEANKKLELADRYLASDSPALRTTGESYKKRATERLTVISSRSPSRTQTGLVTTRGNNKNTVRATGIKRKVKKKEEIKVTKAELKSEPPISQTTKIPSVPEKSSTDIVTSRRTVLRGLLFGSKQAIQKAPQQIADKAKKGLMDTIGDAKWIDDNIQEIGKKGKNTYKRRKVLTKAKSKLVNKAGYELKKNTEGLDQVIDIATLPGKAGRTNRTIKRQSATIVKQAKKARAALGDPAAYYESSTDKKLNMGGKIIRLLGG